MDRTLAIIYNDFCAVLCPQNDCHPGSSALIPETGPNATPADVHLKVDGS